MEPQRFRAQRVKAVKLVRRPIGSVRGDTRLSGGAWGRRLPPPPNRLTAAFSASITVKAGPGWQRRLELFPSSRRLTSAGSAFRCGHPIHTVGEVCVQEENK